MRSTGGTVLEAGEFEVLRRVSREAFSRIEEEGVLPDVHPRTLATSGEKATEGSSWDRLILSNDMQHVLYVVSKSKCPVLLARDLSGLS